MFASLAFSSNNIKQKHQLSFSSSLRPPQGLDPPQSEDPPQDSDPPQGLDHL